MSRTVDYYHFLISPWSYLAIDRMHAVMQKTGATLNYLPIDVGSTFSNMGGVPPGQRHPSRQRFRMDELKRWSAHLGIPMNFTPAYFPADQSLAARMVYAARDGAGGGQAAGKLSDAVLTAVWRDEKNVADTDTLRGIADACGLDGASLLAAAAEAAYGEQFTQATDRAHAADVFGSPTWVVDGELFWGQDRLDFLERALQA